MGREAKRKIAISEVAKAFLCSQYTDGRGKKEERARLRCLKKDLEEQRGHLFSLSVCGRRI